MLDGSKPRFDFTPFPSFRPEIESILIDDALLPLGEADLADLERFLAGQEETGLLSPRRAALWRSRLDERRAELACA